MLDGSSLTPVSHRPSHPGKRIVDRLEVEFFSVKRISCPFPVVVEFLVARLENDLQKLLISVRTSNVLWWAAPLTANAHRALGGDIRAKNLLQHTLMPPIATE